MSEIATFSPEARTALKQQNFVFYTLTGKSLSDLKADGVRIEPNWKEQNPLYTLPSIKSEVSFYWRSLRNGYNQSLEEQLEKVNKYSEKLKQTVPDIDVIIGEAPDYAELANLYFNRTNKLLFQFVPEKPFLRFLKLLFTDGMYARTLTPMSTRRGSFLTMVGDYKGYIEISGFPADAGTHACGVMPLVIPAQTYKFLNGSTA